MLTTEMERGSNNNDVIVNTFRTKKKTRHFPTDKNVPKKQEQGATASGKTASGKTASGKPASGKTANAGPKEHCCTCIRLLAAFIKEIMSSICSTLTGNTPESSRFQEIFCQLGDNTIELFKDLLHLFEKGFHCMIGTKKKKK